MTKMRTINGKRTKSSMSKLDQQIVQHLEPLLQGIVLAIDPSSGSEKSQPGYALFDHGQLVDSGLVRIRSGDALSNRLHRLAASLREDFPQPHVVITENIPPFMGEGNAAKFATRNVISLHQSIGVVMSVWDAPVLLVSPRTWRSHIPDNYFKSDENDAIMIGWTVLKKSKEYADREPMVFDQLLLTKLTTGKWSENA